MDANKKRFLINIIICLIALIVVAFILNYSPGYKRDKYANITNLVINDENVTEFLTNRIYINNEEVYLSKEDIAYFLDKDIYYEENYNTVITSSINKVTKINIKDNTIQINDETQQLKSELLKVNGTMYIPLTELKSTYNIDVKYIPNTDTVVIEDLNKGLIKAKVEETSTMKFKPRAISKDIDIVEQGEEVYCYYTTSKGWRLIRTTNGKIGYVKANVLSNEYIIRQDLNNEVETKEMEIILKDGATITLYDEDQKATKIMIKDLYNFGDKEGISIIQDEKTEGYDIWATISNKGLEKQTNLLIDDYKTRTQLINTIMNFISKYRIKGVNIDFKEVNNNVTFSRFIIELAPRLREKGIVTNIVLNDSIDESKIINIVDFLIQGGK